MLLPVGYSFADFCTALLAAPDGTPAPSVKYPPNGINPKAQDKYWKEFVGKYKKVWGKYASDVERQWACCVAIWINYCVKRKVQPFDPNAAQVSKEAREKLEDRAENARVAQLNLLDALVSSGVRKGVVAKSLKETLHSVEERKPGEYTVLTQRVLVLEKGIEYNSQEFKLFMDKRNFQRKAGRYMRSVKTNTDVIVQMDDASRKPVVMFRNVLTKAYVEMLLGLSDSKSNKEAAKLGLTKFWKDMIRELT